MVSSPPPLNFWLAPNRVHAHCAIWATSSQIKELTRRAFPCSYTEQKMPKIHWVACVWLAVVCNRQQVRNRQVRVWQVQVSGKLQHYRITVPLEHCGAVQCVPLPRKVVNLWSCHSVPQTQLNFRVGTGKPQRKGCEKKREEDGKRRRTIAREGVGL